MLLQPSYFGIGETQASHKFDISKAFRYGSAHISVLPDKGSLQILNGSAKNTCESAKEYHTYKENGDQSPVFGNGIPHEKSYSYQGREQDIDKGRDKFLSIGSHFLKNRQDLPAALFFKFLKRETHGLAQAIIKDLHSKFLHYQPDH